MSDEWIRKVSIRNKSARRIRRFIKPNGSSKETNEIKELIEAKIFFKNS